MPKVGRNDPCPCGSGRKYKNCCMRKDRISEARELSRDSVEGALLDALATYAYSPRFTDDINEALNFYWGGRYGLSEEIAREYEEDLRRGLEWMVHDYHTSTRDQYIIDLFIENEADAYLPEVKEILEAWSESVMGMFRLLEIMEEHRLAVYDPLQERELVIPDPFLAQNAREGDLLVGRLFELGGEYRLSNMTLILPEDYESGLIDYITNAHTIYRDEHPEATWDEFLRENGHLFNAFMLSARGESLRSLIGAGTRFHDPAEFRDKLREHTAEREREIEEEARRERERESEPPDTHRTRSGIIVPGAEPAENPEEQGERPRRSRILVPGRDA
ncbi:MAG: SEC-C metal-binding domain-containing protein [Chloroflexota bacterium]|nr:SEC-C metal-binding domain-containing protein [Chloroflexota bacterium]